MLPESIIALDKPIFKETKAKVRYAYNYCTFSYTMAFWCAEEWRKELDWLALNGVNAVLDITAQEEVWRRFLTKIGYSHNAIKSFLTGPAYYAWLYMSNITGIGGPIHDGWFARRTEPLPEINIDRWLSDYAQPTYADEFVFEKYNFLSRRLPEC